MVFLFVGSSALTEASFPRDLTIPQLLLSSRTKNGSENYWRRDPGTRPRWEYFMDKIWIERVGDTPTPIKPPDSLTHPLAQCACVILRTARLRNHRICNFYPLCDDSSHVGGFPGSDHHRSKIEPDRNQELASEVPRFLSNWLLDNPMGMGKAFTVEAHPSGPHPIGMRQAPSKE
jgi:hypothetical protein